MYDFTSVSTSVMVSGMRSPSVLRVLCGGIARARHAARLAGYVDGGVADHAVEEGIGDQRVGGGIAMAVRQHQIGGAAAVVDMRQVDDVESRRIEQRHFALRLPHVDRKLRR